MIDWLLVRGVQIALLAGIYGTLAYVVWMVVKEGKGKICRQAKKQPD